MGKTPGPKDRDHPCQLDGQMTIDDILIPLGEPPTCLLESAASKAEDQ